MTEQESSYPVGKPPFLNYSEQAESVFSYDKEASLIRWSRWIGMYINLWQGHWMSVYNNCPAVSSVLDFGARKNLMILFLARILVPTDSSQQYKVCNLLLLQHADHESPSSEITSCVSRHLIAWLSDNRHPGSLRIDGYDKHQQMFLTDCNTKLNRTLQVSTVPLTGTATVFIKIWMIMYGFMD